MNLEIYLDLPEDFDEPKRIEPLLLIPLDKAFSDAARQAALEARRAKARSAPPRSDPAETEAGREPEMPSHEEANQRQTPRASAKTPEQRKAVTDHNRLVRTRNQAARDMVTANRFVSLEVKLGHDDKHPDYRKAYMRFVQARTKHEAAQDKVAESAKKLPSRLPG